MKAIEAALGAILRDPNMSAAVTLYGSQHVVTRGLLRQPDEVVDVLGGRVQAETRLLEVRAADVDTAQIADGDLVDVDGVTYALVAQPRHDRDRLMAELEIVRQ